jgi:hypothetical protein
VNGMRSYYGSRLAIAAALGTLVALAGWPWWMGAAAGALAFAWFLAAPRIGRYVVRQEGGVTALRRDERSQRINDAAARNAFVISMLALGGVLLYAGARALESVRVGTLTWVLILGAVAYYASDFWLRRAQS